MDTKVQYLLSNYIDTKIYQTDTKSAAIFVRALKQEGRIESLIKISFDYPDRSNRIIYRQDVLNYGIERIHNSLMIPISIYQHINRLLDSNYSPHVIIKLDHVHLDNFSDILKPL